MRRVTLGAVVLLAMAIAASSVLALPQPPAPSVIVRAAAVNFTLNYSHPASSVMELWTSNNTHVTDAAGNWVMGTTPAEVNLIRVSSSATATTVSVFLKVQGTIAVRANTSYEYRLYTRADNATHYLITFSNGSTWMVSNHTGSARVNLTAGTGVGALGWLGVTLNKTDLGGTANITAWNIDASSREAGPIYTFVDYVWQLPGNPGSAPAFIQGRVTDAATGAGLANVNVSASTGGYYTATNATGYYSLPAAPGNYTLSFSLAGYDSASKSVAVQYQQTQTVNAQLTKGQSGLPITTSIVAGLIVLVIAVGAVAFLLLRRRKMEPRPPEPPKTQE